MCTGWPELHGVRISAEISYTWGWAGPRRMAQTARWSCFWGGGPNLHVSLVSLLSNITVFQWICPIDEYSDVLRRRFQINTMSGMGYQYKSIPDAIKVIVAQEGVKGLYKGIVPNLLKVAPSMASSWLSFEMTRDYLISLKPELNQHTV